MCGCVCGTVVLALVLVLALAMIAFLFVEFEVLKPNSYGPPNSFVVLYCCTRPSIPRCHRPRPFMLDCLFSFFLCLLFRDSGGYRDQEYSSPPQPSFLLPLC